MMVLGYEFYDGSFGRVAVETLEHADRELERLRKIGHDYKSAWIDDEPYLGECVLPSRSRISYLDMLI